MISLEDLNFDASPLAQQFSISYDEGKDQTSLSVATSTYQAQDVVIFDGRYGLASSELRSDGDLELRFSSLVNTNEEITVITDENDATNEVSEETVNGAHGASPPSLTTLILWTLTSPSTWYLMTRRRCWLAHRRAPDGRSPASLWSLSEVLLWGAPLNVQQFFNWPGAGPVDSRSSGGPDHRRDSTPTETRHLSGLVA